MGIKHPDVAGNLNNLGNAYGELGKHQRRIELLNKSLDINKTVFGVKNQNVATSLNNLGNAYGAIGDYKRQMELLHQALEINKDIFGDRHSSVAGILDNLGNAYGVVGNNAKQIELLNQSLEIKKEAFGEAHPDIAASLFNIGSAHAALGESSKAFKLIQEALIRFLEIYDSNNPHVQGARKIYSLLQRLIVKTQQPSDCYNQGCANHVHAVSEAKNGNIEESTRLVELAKNNFEDALSVGCTSRVYAEYANLLLTKREVIGKASEKNKRKIIFLSEEAINLKDNDSLSMYDKEALEVLPKELKEILQAEIEKSDNESEMVEMKSVYLAYFLLIKINLVQENEQKSNHQELITRLLIAFREELEQDILKEEMPESVIAIGHKLYANFSDLTQAQDANNDVNSNESNIETPNQPSISVRSPRIDNRNHGCCIIT